MDNSDNSARSLSPDVVCNNLDCVVEDLKSRLTCDTQIKEATNKFCEKYWTLKMSTTLAASLHQFGKAHFRPTAKKNVTVKHYRHNMIPVQPTATARRRPLLARGRSNAPQGRPSGRKWKAEIELDKNVMPKRGKMSLKNHTVCLN